MMINDPDRDWEQWGKTDPYYAVLADAKYHADHLDESTLAEFFETGRAHIERTFSVIHTHLDPGFRPAAALDFGCGVGRLLVPLASVCETVVGVDVSESMLREAEANCRERGLSNVSLVKSDDRLANVRGTFDFIHSFLVFQHIPRRRGEALFKRLVAHLNDGGVGAMHFVYLKKSSALRRFGYWARTSLPIANGLINLAQGKAFGDPLLQSNRYDLNVLLRILQEAGCSHVFVRVMPKANLYGAMLFFQKQYGQAR